MMRYQRLSPECLPLPNGRKPNLRTCKDDTNHHHDNPHRIPTFPSLDPTKPPRVRSAASTSPDHHFPPSPLSTSDINGVGGDVLLQWGHRKRTRGSRADGKVQRPPAKIQRRSITGLDKSSMAPPSVSGYSRGSNLRPCSLPRDSSSGLNRNGEERSTGFLRPEKRHHPLPPAEKIHKASVTAYGHSSDSMNHLSSTPSSEKEANGTTTALATAEKLNRDHFEWPRIYVSLTRKEKEEDFLAIKGTKLPQRPKKRAKNVDKTLQYCFPGLWLSELTRGRYEVREKKCVKKKKRGLKGMESMDSDSE